MPKIIFLPHEEICPEGAIIEAEPGTTICDAALANGIEISLPEATEDEEDMLDKAWGLEPDSRLSCQAQVDDKDLVVEIPKYTINMVSESH